ILRQTLYHHLQQLEFDLRRGQDFLFKDLLSGLDPWHMCITKNSQPIRLQREHDIQRPVERFHCLVRKAVNEVKIDRTETKFPDPTKHLLSHGSRLNSMHSFLHFCFEVLNPKRSAVESSLTQRNNVIMGQATRIDFDASFVSFREIKMPANDIPKPPNF